MIIKSYEIEKMKSSLIENNIFLLYGENTGLKKEIKEKVKFLVNKKDPKVEEINLIENEIIKNEENFYNLIFSGSLFSTNKIILVHDASDKITSIIKKIEGKFPSDIFLVLFSNALEKKSKLRNLFEKEKKLVCVACYLDTEKNLEIIAFQELKREGINISKESINLLVRKTNGDRINLKNEIEKIKAYTKDNKNIDHDVLKNLINLSGEIKNDSLVNTCLSGEISELKKVLFDIVIENQNQILLLRILSNKVRRLLLIKEQNKDNQTLENTINSVKPPIFWKEKPLVKKQLSIWKKNELVNTINEINDLEISCKKNPQISPVILFNFLTKICKKVSY